MYISIWVLDMTEKSRDGLFEWDTEKNKVNIAKHGISFPEAIGVFLDPGRNSLMNCIRRKKSKDI